MAVKVPDFRVKTNLDVQNDTRVGEILTVVGDANFLSDIEVDGDALIDGNLTVKGTTTFIESSSIKVEDPLLTLGRSNTATDVLDIGFIGTYNDGNTAINGGVRHTGLFRDASDKSYKIFGGLSADPGSANTINANDSSFGFNTFRALLCGVDLYGGSVANSKLENSVVTINNNPVSLGGSVTVPVHSHKDTTSFDFSVGTTLVNGAVTDTLSGDVRLYGTSLDSLSDGTDSGIKIANSGVSTIHIGDSQVTNVKLQNSTFSVNGIVGSLGSNVEIDTVGEHLDSNSINMHLDGGGAEGQDSLSADVRLYDTTLSIVSDGTGTGLKITNPTFSVNSVAANLGGNVNIPIVGDHLDSKTINMHHDTGNDTLSADVKLYDGTLSVLSDGSGVGLKITNPTFSVNNVQANLGGNVNIPIAIEDGIVDSNSIDLSVQNPDTVNSQLQANFRHYDTTLETVSDASGVGVRVNRDDPLMFFSVNGVSANIGAGITIPTVGDHLDSDSINMHRDLTNDNLSADIRHYDTTIETVSDASGVGIRVDRTSPLMTWGVNAITANIGSTISIPLVGDHIDSHSIDMNHDSVNDTLSADLRHADDTLETVAGGVRVNRDSNLNFWGVNSLTANIGQTIDLPVIGTHLDSASINMNLEDVGGSGNTLSADVRIFPTNSYLEILSSSPSDVGIRLTEHTFSVNGVEGNLGDNIAISTFASGTSSVKDSPSIDLDIVNDVLSADVRHYDSTIESLSDASNSGIRIKDGQVTTQHLSGGAVTTAKITDDAVTNAKIETPTFSVNGVAGDLGTNITISSLAEPIILLNAKIQSLRAAAIR